MRYMQELMAAHTRALPARRRSIPKPGGKQRPLGVWEGLSPSGNQREELNPDSPDAQKASPPWRSNC